MYWPSSMTLAILSVPAMLSPTLEAGGNADRGQRIFGACAACHSLEPDLNMNGSELAGMWNRKTGAVSTFMRYSPALKSSGVVWNDNTLENGLLIRSI